MKELENGVCAPKGFRAAGIRCGIKASSAKKDLALIASDTPCVSAAVFTANLVKAASVRITAEHIARGGVRALVVNSGNANACTGDAGAAAARRMAEAAAAALGTAAAEIAVASTGVIGVPLPIDLIENAAPSLRKALTALREGSDDALEAIMTTDTKKKHAALEIELPGGGTVRIGAIVKGSGMIHPNMATMIAIITSDAAIRAELLDRALRRAVKRTFNRLSVDGDTSTNDMALIMANGEAGNAPIENEGPDYTAFASALETICEKLTRLMARDGEGATKLLTVNVRGAQSEEAAAVLARAVTASSLVKAACFGADANWGRVLCALGYAGVPFSPEKTAIAFASRAGSVTVCKKGGPVEFSEEKAKEILLEEEIVIEISVGTEAGEASAWGCDLSYDYVKINGDYRS
ncbi:MAG: bifunctional glutamate N-acetyltransferase/amino-acid acetyltransferase ArgJ [Treponema sp.]|jgi:glutamate N-acetyltransferase/amino-acid N-acetyltransferase|nr:bifunctional glutamate N-acetyltransferase/amino-acid acetyltransferase ArgJ [Treponema sp.]